jgi:2-polyprenyl-6-methoxyphenol hydroxylase-like FAD-dependent oxidoreductase
LALEQLLPGLTDALVAGGARTGDISGRCQWFVGGGRFARGDGAARAIGLTRPFLEHQVRTRVAALPGVTVRDRTQVVGPLADRSGRGEARVVGVEVRPTGGGDSEQLPAGLVVDASGRGSKLPDWLRELGYLGPVEEQVHCKMAYLTRRWRLRNGVFDQDIFAAITPAESAQFGVLIAQEDGSHIVTLGGLLDRGPQRDDAAYLAFARNLPDPLIAEALEGAEPLTDLQPSHFPYSRRRRYDRLRRFPDGLLAIGDAIASFNPMYGQGMTVAALEALALRDGLERGALDAARFFKRAHRIEDVAWKISTGGDLRYAEVEGKRTPDQKMMNRYLDRLTLAARVDPVLAQQFLRVAGFMQRPESLFRPSVIRRVLAGRRLAQSARLVATAPLTTPPVAPVV